MIIVCLCAGVYMQAGLEIKAVFWRPLMGLSEVA